VPGSADDEVDAANVALAKKISSIHAAIKPLGREVLSDPTTFTPLAFPSPLRVLTERFTVSNEGTLEYFQYMGRSNFEDLWKEIEERTFIAGSSTLYLYGPSGTGKSHLLAALVYYLVGQGERVFFIPDCRSLVNGAERPIRKALLFAFHNDPSRCSKIHRAPEVRDLVQFVKSQPDYSMYIVVDQLNSLNLDGPNDLRSRRKIETLEIIDSLRSLQRYIFSASANQQSDRDSDRRQSEIKTFYLRAGLNELCPHLFNYFISYPHRTRPAFGSRTISPHCQCFLPQTAGSSKTLLGTSPS